MRRKMLTPTFHFKILNDFVRVFVEESRNLVSRLKVRVQRLDLVQNGRSC